MSRPGIFLSTLAGPDWAFRARRILYLPKGKGFALAEKDEAPAAAAVAASQPAAPPWPADATRAVVRRAIS